jgi:hypothetical protein
MPQQHDNELIRAVETRCRARLGDKVDDVQVGFFDMGDWVTVAIRAGQLRHAVYGFTNRVREDPSGWADAASDKLLGWIAARRAQ